MADFNLRKATDLVNDELAFAVALAIGCDPKINMPAPFSPERIYIVREEAIKFGLNTVLWPGRTNPTSETFHVDINNGDFILHLIKRYDICLLSPGIMNDQWNARRKDSAAIFSHPYFPEPAVLCCVVATQLGDLVRIPKIFATH